MFFALSALAADTWTDPFPGVRHLERTNGDPNVIHALEVDLCARGVSLRATRESERQDTTSSFGERVDAEAAINGDFFSYEDYYPIGLAIGNGEKWSSDTGASGFVAFGDDRAWISETSERWNPPADWMHDVVGGHPYIVHDGVALRPELPTSCSDRNPHTAVGLSRDRRTLWLVTVDGRSSASIGMTCDELADELADLGAWTALSVDGGGSTTMWLASDGVVNDPSDGDERVVSNHLALFADGTGPPQSCDFELAEVRDLSHLYDTRNTNVDGDGRMDLCGRSAAGYACQMSTGTGFGPEATIPALSDDAGWAHPDNWATIRMADIDGDHRSDVCARSDEGVRCWVWDGAAFGPEIVGPPLTDDAGWAEVARYSTIRFGDLDGDGDDDLCARSADGVVCYPSNGDGFGDAIVGPAWSNAAGWAVPDRYGTLAMGDVDGDGRDDLCARSSEGLVCGLSSGAGFPTEVSGPSWSDTAGFTEVAYWGTIRLVDLDHDGRANVCARTPDGIECARSTGAGFGPTFAGPPLTDADGWVDHGNASTIRTGDVDGDGDEDLCARTDDGMACWLQEGDAFVERFDTALLADDDRWNDARYYATIDLADVDGDGRADLCGRDRDGMSCWPAGAGGFGARIAGPAWSDDAGWDAPDQFGTIRISGVGAPVDSPDSGTEPTTGPSPTTPADEPPPSVTDRVDPPPPGCACDSSPSAPWWLVLAFAGWIRMSFGSRTE